MPGAWTVAIAVCGIYSAQNASFATAQKSATRSKTETAVTEPKRANFDLLSKSDWDHIQPSEIAKHNEPDDCWLVINDFVYDASEYMHDHPGGPEIIRYFGGTECSWQFWKFHAPLHLRKQDKLIIGWTDGRKVHNPHKPPRDTLAKLL
ncbi:uncharacterized protein L969DRAFT_100849 [Mixia osmundae IAM 14324]|uniref:Cytochrome b5 heme-binding domain-containing protein n=1 Tax=Mixia osmundae (strain CBS 9802 / IAM 14324 / JCM 22182 / KY 12970) TaxID=764103 RepID=G7EAK7_MIXOS|nr:uncharacterized protein L969DRAFT_100849 [Mixia osmundae IAM 14324]KEI42357.1 hypothetical protein L969DRAFT_100849 [Mixia osmundae IAM 14324]GAA99867.1 hypothetical protein E5Q_06570 [Mixia osmundae IAM 14324]